MDGRMMAVVTLGEGGEPVDNTLFLLTGLSGMGFLLVLKNDEQKVFFQESKHV